MYLPLYFMKFFGTALLMIVLAAVGWRYVPLGMRAGILAFVGIAAQGNRAEVKHFIQDIALPKDPQERRAVLAGELEKNIAELKRRAESGTGGVAISFDAVTIPGASGTAIRTASAQELLNAAESMVKELESANKDEALGGKVMRRILDTVLPAPPMCLTK